MRQEDFEGACALKAELKQLAAQPAQTAALFLETQRLQAQLEVCVQTEDFAGAAILKAELRALTAKDLQQPPQNLRKRSSEVEARTLQLKTRLADCVDREDFEGAASLKAQLRELCSKHGQQSSQHGEDAPLEPNAESRGLEAQLAQCLEKEDFEGAAALKLQLGRSSEVEARTLQLKTRLADCVGREDFEGAAALKA